jgi:hypothetical protein
MPAIEDMTYSFLYVESALQSTGHVPFLSQIEVSQALSRSGKLMLESVRRLSVHSGISQRLSVIVEF